jgi:galactoside O-acetyltransferase
MRIVFALVRRLVEKWEYLLATRWRRLRLILSCRSHRVELELGRNVHFHHPVRVYGVGGKLVIGDDVWFAFYGGNRYLGPIHFQLREPDAELRIERNVWLMPATQIVCFHRITIGAETMFGYGCSIIDSDVHDFSPDGGVRPGKSAAVKIGKGVRICPETTILKGVSVGDHTVVGNKSVVQGSLPARCVAAGNPARVFLQYKDPEPAKPKEPAVA